MPIAHRRQFLDQMCGSEADFRAQVDSLLAAADRAGDFMAGPTLDGSSGALRPAASNETPHATALSESPQHIGPYKLLERIGEGGFGTVFMAEQDEPVRRRVAVKVIKPGMDTRQVIARFEAERQALAMMDHPNIARVLDGGETHSGLPYFAMELVRGDPLTRFCDQHNLTIPQRLGLFIDVCYAVQHAHQKGVIHRDIKPSNVLVTMHDDKPVPKVIDFGIAKALHERLTDKTLFTEFRQLIGTPEYMSPEQTQMNGIDVDTRSDVYSLGVLLYELLTGVTPFDRETLRKSSFDELRRIIREVDPPKPSTRLSSLLTTENRGRSDRGIKGSKDQERTRGTDVASADDSSAQSLNSSITQSLASSRHTEPASLARHLRGDLDWIVMKCLEKDRTRRYETTSALAADVQRHLVGEPVFAAPPSRLYRLTKTLRRHRTAGAVATSFVLLIAAGLAATSILWQQAAHARDAESNQRARAEAINTFLKDMLTAADPAKAKGEKLTVREVLDRAAKEIDEHPMKDQPLVEAEIRSTIGSTYNALSLCSEAEAQLRAADALHTRELGNEHPDTLRTRHKLAQTLATKTDFEGAIALAQPTLDARRRVLGADDPDTLQSMVLLGRVLWAQVGRFTEAEALLCDAIERLERVRGPNHQDTAMALSWLGELYAFNSYAEKAEPFLRRAVRIHAQALGEEHRSTLHSMSILATSLHNQNRPEEAVALNRRVVEVRLRVLGADHMDTIAVRGTLAFSLNGLGHHSEAEPMHRENLAALLRTVGPTHSNTITEKRYLAHCLERQARYPESEALLGEALDTARETYGIEDADTSIKLMCALSRVLALQHKDAEAEQVARQVLEFLHRQLPRPDPALLAEASIPLTQVLKRRGANEEALRVEQALIEAWLAAAHGPDGGAGNLNGAARRLLQPENEQLRDAPRALELALKANERSGQQNPRHLNTLAQAYILRGDSARAMLVWKQAIALLPDDAARAVMLNGAAWELLTITPESLRDSASALELALKANDLSRYEIPTQLDTLALAYHRAGASGKAIEIQKKAIALLATDAPGRAEYEARLAEFEAALEKARGKNGTP